jgi:hypothetical protein
MGNPEIVLPVLKSLFALALKYGLAALGGLALAFVIWLAVCLAVEALRERN